jgi:hypothetical protein
MDAQCDTTSGACPNSECDTDWYGEYCQTGNNRYEIILEHVNSVRLMMDIYLFKKVNVKSTGS